MNKLIVMWHAAWYRYYSKKYLKASYQLTVEMDSIKRQQVRAAMTYYGIKAHQHFNHCFI